MVGQHIAIHAVARPPVTGLPQDVLDDICGVFGSGWKFRLPRGFVFALRSWRAFIGLRT
jgi:hypothetical protein